MTFGSIPSGSSDSVTGLYETDDLEAEPVLPGFRCKLADVLPARST
jgi:hypothetical protein